MTKLKCDEDGCCEFLLSRLEEFHKRGFVAIHVLKMDGKVGHAKTNFRGVAYKQTAKDRGIMLNWCPFCGGHPGTFKRDIPEQGGGNENS